MKSTFLFPLGFALSIPFLVSGCSEYSTEAQDQAYQPQQPQQQVQQQPQQVSQDPRVDLAQFLATSGARMYTTGWCPTCKRQLREFGEQAQAILKSIEVNCEERPDECADKGVHQYPTWEFNGRLQKAGGFPLSQLAQLAGFPNTQAFAQGRQMEEGMQGQPSYMQQPGGYPQ